MNTEDTNHLQLVLRHIDNVQQSCLILGYKMIEAGDQKDGLQLIANSQIHDNSKLRPGIEWQYLRDGFNEKHSELFKAAHLQHVSTNPHHPEYWPNGIKDMPPVYIAEMVCDWKARSSEFGTDLRGYVKDTATKRFGFTVQSAQYKLIKKYLDLLLGTPFK
jgi:hypothetical protein